MTTGNQYRSDSFPAKSGATACLPSVRAGTPAGSSTPLRSEKSNGRLYRLGGVSVFRGRAFALIPALLVFLALPLSAQTGGALPTVTPVAVQPIGQASGGGVVTRVTYEMKLAANDAAVASAANEARYISRAVTVSGPTMGGIVRGVVAGGLRLSGWVSAALLAYEAYKWIKDQQGNLVTSPVDVPPGSAACGSTGYWWAINKAFCSFPGTRSTVEAWAKQSYGSGTTIKSADMDLAQNRGIYTFQLSNGANPTLTIEFYPSADNTGVTDPGYVIPSQPVTDAQLGDLAQQHPEWWPDMLRDPLTNQPLITPEIAADMDALKQHIAPEYGVDPQTIPQTQPDPNYQQGKAEPRPQSMPDFCAWASRACQHYDFVEDKLTIPTFDPTLGPDDPVSSVFIDKPDDGLAALDGSGFLGGGSCPGFPPIEYFGQTINYGEGLCRTSALIGPWLVGMGYALALLIGLRLKAGG